MLLIAPRAYGQITITENDLRLRLGSEQISMTTFTATSLTGLQAVADQTGGSQQFDLRTATFGPGDSFSAEQIACANDIPGCTDPDFSTANFIAREVHAGGHADSTAVFFARFDNDGFYTLGAASRGDFDPGSPGLEEAAFKFRPALLNLKLPLTMGTAWTANSTLEFVTKTDLSASITLDEDGNVESTEYTRVSDPVMGTEPGGEVPARIALAQNFPNAKVARTGRYDAALEILTEVTFPEQKPSSWSVVGTGRARVKGRPEITLGVRSDVGFPSVQTPGLTSNPISRIRPNRAPINRP